ncbi:MAG: DoxX family protein [Salinivirgaceae bacterium]|nr:MAG: DoxX family protein [Salinivirgaceae bacterium]
MKINQKSSLKYVHTGLLIIRLGIGIMFILHGLPKLMGGPDKWEAVGGAMESLGIYFFPTFWGFMAGFAETVGGLLLILGLAFMPAALMMAFTMFIAFLKHYTAGDGFSGYSHAFEAMILFIGLAITGPGKYRLSKMIIK